MTPAGQASGSQSAFFSLLSVNVAESIRELMCSRPTDSDEDVQDIHEGGLKFGSFSQHVAVLGKVLLDHAKHKSFRERFVLIAVFTSGAHNVAGQDQDLSWIEVNEVFEGFEDIMRGG
jgi:hypothetical protein